jgi:hypothetical protein
VPGAFERRAPARPAPPRDSGERVGVAPAHAADADTRSPRSRLVRPALARSRQVPRASGWQRPNGRGQLPDPDPDAEQRARINGSPRRDGTDREPARFSAIEEFRRRRGDIYLAIESTYIQNRVGLFELTCTYTSTKRGMWNGTVRSKRFYLRIEDDGDWFTQGERLRSGKLRY